jgi:formylglycine-generating enzyme required for sulfatase activity
MPNIFISYSRTTKETALQLRRALQLNGITDIFLDLDPVDGLPAGSKWEETLKDSVLASRAVVLLISPAWLRSRNCRNEYYWAVQGRMQSEERPRRPLILPILIEGATPDHLTVDALRADLPDLQRTDPPRIDQLADLRSLNMLTVSTSFEVAPDAERDGTLTRARADVLKIARRTIWEWLEPRLNEVGVHPVRMPFQPGRAPYPGLAALDEPDQPVFFGRAAEVDDCVDLLTHMRIRRGRNLLVIQAASGAGKSSLLRAGILARLKLGHTDDFYCLPTVRPGEAAITGRTGLARSLVGAFNPAKTYPSDLYHDPRTNTPVQFPAFGAVDLGAIAARLDTALDPDTPFETAMAHLELLLEQLVFAASPRKNGHIVDRVTLILPIDQAEELLPPEPGERATAAERKHHEQATHVRKLLAALLSRRHVPLIAVLAIRSDSFPRLQQDHLLGNTVDKTPFDLSPMPAAGYGAVIEGPAPLVEVEMEPALVSRLIHDLQGQGDALPLLAFALRKLYDAREQKPADVKARMELADYDGAHRWSIGGLQGAIEKEAKDSLLRAIGRNIASDRAFQRQVRDLFVGHLATIDPDTGQVLRRIGVGSEFQPGSEAIAKALVEARILTTATEGRYEVAHEAVLRQWRRVRNWLDAARGAMRPVQEARIAAKAWSEARTALVAAHGEASLAVAAHDRESLPIQSEVDRIETALRDLGRDPAALAADDPLRAYLAPESVRLERELTVPALDHARRAEIGDRLAQLGLRTVGNEAVQFGDLRPGVGVMTPSRVAVLRAEGADADRAAGLDAWAAALAAAGVTPDTANPTTEDERGIPQLLWCAVPAGEVRVQRDEEALRTWADGDTSSPPQADPVTLTVGADVWIARYPITYAQFVAFTGAGRERAATYKDPRWWAGFPAGMDDFFKSRVQEQATAPNYPAQYVTWYQAVAYCRWLTDLYRRLGAIPETAEIRLPFEAEWVMAATGGDGRRYPWGETWDASRCANQDGANRFVACGLYPLGASPVGAMDMSGNVYEWCLDAYDDLANPAPNEERTRATRGGSYYTQARARPTPHACSVHHRFQDNPWGLTLPRDNPAATRIAAGLRPVCVGLDPARPLVAVHRP